MHAPVAANVLTQSTRHSSTSKFVCKKSIFLTHPGCTNAMRPHAMHGSSPILCSFFVEPRRSSVCLDTRTCNELMGHAFFKRKAAGNGWCVPRRALYSRAEQNRRHRLKTYLGNHHGRAAFDESTVVVSFWAHAQTCRPGGMPGRRYVSPVASCNSVHTITLSRLGVGQVRAKRQARVLELLPICRLRQRRNRGEFALVKTGQCGVDHVLG